MGKPFKEDEIPEDEKVFVMKINVWVNDKLVDEIIIGTSLDEEEIYREVLNSPKVKNEIDGKNVSRQIGYDLVTYCVTVKITIQE